MEVRLNDKTVRYATGFVAENSAVEFTGHTPWEGVRVAADGEVRTWDRVGNIWTRHHGLSPWECDDWRQMAEAVRAREAEATAPVAGRKANE